MSRPGQQSEPPESNPLFETRVSWRRAERRQEKIRRQIQRNRAGGHRVPTWVLTLILVALLGVIAFWIWGP